MNYLNNHKLLVGKEIRAITKNYDYFFISFSDYSFVAFRADYEEVRILEYQPDLILAERLDLKLITKEEYEESKKKERLAGLADKAERIRKEQEKRRKLYLELKEEFETGKETPND